jgi:hypothetical protein
MIVSRAWCERLSFLLSFLQHKRGVSNTRAPSTDRKGRLYCLD